MLKVHEVKTMPSTKNKITVLLADDHPIVRKGVRSLLEQEPDIRVVGEAGDGREAIEKVRELSPDVLVVDISMPDLNGIEATRHITQTFPETRVVALSVHSSGQFIKDMFKAGAGGYLLKESAPEELTTAIHTVMRGEVFLSTAIAGKVVSGFVNGSSDAKGAVGANGPDNEKPLQEGLVRTKFHRPELPHNHLHRHLLVEKLQRARHKPLTLVSAPAGYGKSVLVSCWLDNLEGPCAWLSLDKDDDDPRRFLSYFLAAVASIFPDAVPRTTAMVQALEMPPVKELRSSLINELDRIREDYILVLDDFHHLRHRSISELLGSLLQHPPAHMHLVLIARRDPFLPISTLRAQRRITEIRTADLRFTHEETALFLNQTLETEVDLSVAASWAEKTEGWCTGLRLAALAMGRRGDSRIPADMPDSIQYVLEYLFKEVFAYQPEEMHRWLLGTAILDRFCAPLCEAVVGRKEGQTHTPSDGWQFIRYLKQESLFFIELDSEKCWFRYHHLFHRLLKNQLMRHREPEAIARLHQRASEWFRHNGLITEAIQYALKGGATDQAVRLVEQHRHAVLNAGRLHNIEKWLSLFPDDVSRFHPELLLTKALVFYFQSRFQYIEPIIDHAEILIGEKSMDTVLKSEVDFFRGYLLLYQGEGDASLIRIKRALEGIPAGHQGMIGLALMFLGLGEQMCGRMDQAVQMLSSRYDDPSTPYPCRVRVISALVWICLIAGDLDAAALYNRQQRDLAGRREDLQYLANSDYVQGLIHFHRYELDAAIRYFAKALEYSYMMMRKPLVDCMAGLAMACQANGRRDRATATLEKLFDHCHEVGDVGAVALAASCQRRLQLPSTQTDGVDMSEPSVDEAPSPVESMFWWIEVPAITRCRELMANGSRAGLLEAERRLQAFLQRNEALHNRCQAIPIMSLMALNVHRQGRNDESLEILEKVVRLAEPGGWVQPFVEVGPPMAELLEQLQNRGIAVGYIGRLLAVIQECASPSGERGIQLAPARQPSHPSMVEPLTNREQDILELLVRRWQNKEIADNLCVSSETVKTHLKNIYQKLDVPSRIKAVEKARQLGLLPEK